MKSILSLLNPVVVLLANSPLHFLFSHSIVVLNVRGARSGKMYVIPVSYLKTKSGIICMTERAGLWWKNLAHEQQLDIQLAGKRVSASVNVEKEDVGIIATALEKFCRNSRASAYFARVALVAGQPKTQDIDAAAPKHVLIELTF